MRMQAILSGAIGLIASGSGGQLTLAELLLLFVQTYSGNGKARKPDDFNPLVKDLLSRTSHPGTLSFWRDEWANWTVQARREWVHSTTSRIQQYLFDRGYWRRSLHGGQRQAGLPAVGRWRLLALRESALRHAV